MTLSVFTYLMMLKFDDAIFGLVNQCRHKHNIKTAFLCDTTAHLSSPTSVFSFRIQNLYYTEGNQFSGFSPFRSTELSACHVSDRPSKARLCEASSPVLQVLSCSFFMCTLARQVIEINYFTPDTRPELVCFHTRRSS